MNSMEREEIIKAFLTRGYQINNEVLDFFKTNPDKIHSFLDNIRISKERNLIINKDILSRYLVTESVKIKLIKTKPIAEEKISVEEFVKNSNTKYEFLKKILGNKGLKNLISVNKISSKIGNFSLIVRINAVDNGTQMVEAEDPTGKTDIFFKEASDLNFVLPGAILGIHCSYENNSIFCEDLFFPDVPLKRSVSKAKEEVLCLFLSDLTNFNFSFLQKIPKTKKQFLFIFKNTNKDSEAIRRIADAQPEAQKIIISNNVEKEDSDTNLTLPSSVKIHDINIFLYNQNLFTELSDRWNLTAEKVCQQLLKMRLIPNLEDGIPIEKDPLFFDSVPDIFIVFGNIEPKILNYKGVTIIVGGNFMVDLKTRENIKIDLH